MIAKTITTKLPLFAGALALALSTAVVADTAPTTGTDILSVAQHSAQFSTLTKAIEAAGLDSEFSAAGPMTVFAPTDAAFAKLPPEQLASLLLPENKDKLKKILNYHVVPGKAYDEASLKKIRNAETAAGEPVKFALVNGRLRVDNARTSADIDASNGVIIPIDRVLIPL